MSMEIPVSPFVLTKLRTPALRSQIIHRERLIRPLAEEKAVGFILVCAPAGYGKTTFLTEWAQSLKKSGAAVAWYGLDAADDDPIAFGAYLIASFVQALGVMPELTQIAQLQRSSPALGLERVVQTVINVAVSWEKIVS